ncbi:hypothetical protein E2F48_04020 [Arthrobacter crusticola]|uniref:Uncharacterized protein n=1 Tax=Arthrobacter crusticola TaxID=2547960 RepID=A0A4R5TYS3_9MICC|nr:hypothetical protein [Arthrobacter crusticola]TDK26376.1 hypothetical protein E2F48_04020 [Arthrobacter crusticola]
MLIREDTSTAAPDPRSDQVMLKGIGAGAVLGLVSGGLILLLPGYWSVGAVPFAMVAGLIAGTAVGLVCTVLGLLLHLLAERFVPVLRAPAAALGAALVPLVTAVGSPGTWHDLWPVLAAAAVAAVLAVWFTRPLRRTPER